MTRLSLGLPEGPQRCDRPLSALREALVWHVNGPRSLSTCGFGKMCPIYEETELCIWVLSGVDDHCQRRNEIFEQPSFQIHTKHLPLVSQRLRAGRNSR